MPAQVRRGAGAAAILLTMAGIAAAAVCGPASIARAGSVDCWLLDGQDLEKARADGLCRDAFSRNSQAGEPPVITAPGAPVPARKPAPPARTESVKSVSRAGKTTTTVQASRVVRPARGAPPDSDFGSRFQHDWNALMNLFAKGGPSGGGSQPPNGGPASTPAHLSRTGR